MTLLFTFLIASFNMLHVGQMAEYKIYNKGNTILMKVILEDHEIRSFDFGNTCESNETPSICSKHHILKNLLVKINDDLILFEFENSYTDNGHLTLNFKGKMKPNSIKKIDISNTCFFEFDSSYRNRLAISLGKFEGSYMLTKNKNKITLH